MKRINQSFKVFTLMYNIKVSEHQPDWKVHSAIILKFASIKLNLIVLF